MNFNGVNEQILMKMKQVYILLGILILIGCHDTKVGFLKADNASYGIDSLIIRKELNMGNANDKNRLEKEIPWLTDLIQGVLGTAPLRYELYGVKAPSLEAEMIFREEFKIRGGGRMELPLYTKLPVGRYIVSLRVYNEDYSVVLPDVYTFIVKEK